jgi:hypothetical protein
MSEQLSVKDALALERAELILSYIRQGGPCEVHHTPISGEPPRVCPPPEYEFENTKRAQTIIDYVKTTPTVWYIEYAGSRVYREDVLRAKYM